MTADEVRIPPPRLGSGALADAVQVLRDRTERLVKQQHVVSQVLLRHFTAADPNGGRVLRVCNLEFGTWRTKGTSKCGYFEHWMPVLSESIERLWQEVEAKLRQAIATVPAGTVFDEPQALGTLRDAVALHHVRSIHMRAVAQRAADEAYLESRRRAVDLYGGKIVETAPQRNVRIPKTRTELEEILDEQVRERGFPEVDFVFRHKMAESFGQVKEIFRDFSIQILQPPGEREFLIADVPVCGYQFGSKKLGPLDGLGLFDTDHFTMPVTPKHAIRLSASGPSGYLRLSGTESDKVNARQIQHAYRELYTRPGSRAEDFVKRNMAAWRKPAAISPLSIL